MNPDLVNGSIQIIGGVLLFRNSYLILKHKQVRGVSLLPAVFFSIWALWNLYYYPYLGQMISFAGALTVAAANILWLGLAIHYMRKEKKK